MLEESDHYGEQWTHAYAHWVTGLCQWHLGNFDDARRSQIAALEIQREFLDGICTALTIEQMSRTAASNRHFENAALLFQTAQDVWKSLGTSIAAFGPHIRADSERTAALVLRELGPSKAEALYAGRAALSREQAIEFALSAARAARAEPKVASPRASVTITAKGAAGPLPAGPGSTELTRRENQVAALVAEGRSNKEIAAVLVVSPRTVDGHVERILAKLGFTSRAQVAAWVAAHALRR